MHREKSDPKNNYTHKIFFREIDLLFLYFSQKFREISRTFCEIISGGTGCTQHPEHYVRFSQFY